MPGAQLHFVGGVPLASAEEVFATTSRLLGAHLPRIPDGEVGRPWMAWFAPIITENPFLERTDEEFRPHPGGQASFRYRLAPGVSAEEVRFTGLKHAAVAIESYGIFKRLKEAGRVERHAKFQVTLAHPIPVIRRYFPEELQDALEPAFEAALLAEVAAIAAAIPHDQFAIQWDCASAVFATLERGEPSRFGRRREEMYGPLAERLARFGRAVPPDVDLLYHFCYGDNNHRHSVEPIDMGDMTDMANRLTRAVKRPINLIHMPVPRDRSDDAYFAPLKDLKLAPQTEIALGLVHLTGGLDGIKQRMATARRHLGSFAIATECGFGRRPPETMPTLIQLHADAAKLD